MPYKDKKERQRYQKEYRKKNRERLNEYQRKWHQKYYNNPINLKRRQEYMRTWWKRNKEQKRIYSHKYNEALKLKVFNHYSNNDIKCKYCSERRIECLQLDHIKNNGYEERKKLKRSGANFYKWLIDNNFPEGYQVLCANCNMYKRFHPSWRGVL